MRRERWKEISLTHCADRVVISRYFAIEGIDSMTVADEMVCSIRQYSAVLQARMPHRDKIGEEAGGADEEEASLGELGLFRLLNSCFLTTRTSSLLDIVVRLLA